MKKRFLDEYKKYAPALVRYAVGVVFLLLGIDQLTRPINWLAWTPQWVGLFGENGFWVVVGIFNLIIGGLLLLGLLVRVASFLAALHLVGVIITVGYNDIAIRDFGLLLASLAVLLNGKDEFCFGGQIGKKNS